MRRLPAKREGVALDTKSPKHGPEREIEIKKNRTLLDVQFEIRGRICQFFAGIFHFLEIDSVFLDCIDEANSLFVFEPARLVHVDLARASG